MASRSILLAVPDLQTLIDVNQALAEGWEATSVTTEAEAVAHLEKRSFDALLVDFNIGSPDGSELLNLALEKRPEISRFLLAHEADLALVAAKVLGSHEILPKPIEALSLKTRIENNVNESNSPEKKSEESSPNILSRVSSIYSEILEALEAPGATKKQVGEIIRRDAALTAEILELSRSAYLGLPGDVTDPAEAVGSLGLEAVKALVMARKFLAEHSHLKPAYLSLEQIWEHSRNVAQMARDLVLFETEDRTLASQALAAGLLHDLGKVVLATNFDDLYGRVHSLARKQPVPLWDIEKEMFGADHGEIGACLVGMWNVPSYIVDAAAFHHTPPLGEHEELTPLAAVHVANVLEHQLRPNDDFRVAPVINTTFLNELGLLQRLPVWRARFSNHEAGNQQWLESVAKDNSIETTSSGPSRIGSSRTANQLSGRAGETRTTSSASSKPSSPLMSNPRSWPRHWVYAGAAAGALCLLGLWVEIETKLDEPVPVYARTPALNQPSSVAVSTPATESVPAAAPEKTATISAAETASATNASSLPKSSVSQPAPVPVPAPASATAATNVATASLPTKNPAPPEFRLSGIIYRAAHPSAILNGRTVGVGDSVDGATVVSISQLDVTLKINGARKVYKLR